MPLSDGIEKRPMSIRVPMPLYKKVEAIAKKEARGQNPSDSVKMTQCFLMILEIGLEEYQDRYGITF